MKLTYTGKEKEFTEEQQAKLDGRFSRLAKLVERKGERKAHVVLKSARHENKAEITMNLHDHPLVAVGSHSDIFLALTEAAENLEKQVQKLAGKRRSLVQRSPVAKRAKESGGVAVTAAVAAGGDEAQAVRVYRVKPGRQKPMTVEEALLVMGDKGDKKDYVLFRDTDTDAVSVLIRRVDGNFDLLQA